MLVSRKGEIHRRRSVGCLPVTDWNFADVWEAVADTVPHAPALIHGERRVTWGDIDRRANGVAHVPPRPRGRPPGQGGPLPLQLPRVPGVDVRRSSRRASSRSTPTTATPTTSSSTSGTTPTPWPSSSTAPSSTASTGSGPGYRASGPGCGSTTAPTPAHRGPPPTKQRRRRERDRVDARPGAASGDDLYHALHGRDHRHAQGRHVAPGRPLRRAQRREPAPGPRRRAASTAYRQDHRGSRPSASSRPAPSCTARGRSRSIGCLNVGGSRRHPHRTAGSTRSSSSTPSTRENVNAVAIVGDAFAKPILRHPRREPRAAGSCPPCSPSSRPGSCGARRPSGACCTHHPTMMLVDAFSSSEALGMGDVGVERDLDGAHRPLHSRPRSPGPRPRDGQGRAPRVRARSACWPSAAATRSATTRTTEKSAEHLQGDRRGPLLDPRRLRHGRRRRIASSCSGRGSVVINTGGEKVFPEEVEEVTQDSTPPCRDAVAVGIPDERFGRGRGRCRGTATGHGADRGRSSSTM